MNGFDLLNLCPDSKNESLMHLSTMKQGGAAHQRAALVFVVGAMRLLGSVFRIGFNRATHTP
ncbi:hypothetical protein RA27_14385 [Ruegeria sp. ANG-R]|nr:hypothetical protein RA27_14385 [Ruegeria sp. ANG-R]